MYRAYTSEQAPNVVTLVMICKSRVGRVPRILVLQTISKFKDMVTI